MGELQVVRVDGLDFHLTMVYFNNFLDLLVRRHCPSTIIWMFCTIAAFCVDDLVVIVSFLLPDFLDFFSAYCRTFTARTDLSSLSPTRCSTRACMGPWIPSLAVFIASICSVFFCSPPGCFSDPRSPIAGCDRVHVSCSWHTLQTSSFAFLF